MQCSGFVARHRSHSSKAARARSIGAGIECYGRSEVESETDRLNLQPPRIIRVSLGLVPLGLIAFPHAPQCMDAKE